MLDATCTRWSDVFAQLNVPVSEIDEMLPTIVTVQAEIDLHKRTPFRPLWFADKIESGFLRRAIGFLCIAFDARANNIFPRRRAPAVTRDDMV